MKTGFFAVVGVVVLIVIGGLILQASGHLPSLDQWLDSLNPFMPQRAITTVGDAIITDIQQVSRLTTAIYTIQQVEADDDSGFGWYWRVVLVVRGTVEAGLDLSQLDASDITVSEDGKSITVNLPPVMILTERRLVVHTNEGDTYAWEKWKTITSDVNLDLIEQDLRAKAGDKILETACDDGILQKATEDAKATIERFLKTTTPDYNITVVSAPVPSVEECQAAD